VYYVMKKKGLFWDNKERSIKSSEGDYSIHHLEALFDSLETNRLVLTVDNLSYS
jgi:hypothetical protein